MQAVRNAIRSGSKITVKEFLKRRGLLIMLIVLLLCIITIGSLYISGNRSSFITGAVNTAMHPVKNGIKSGVDLLESLYGYIYEYDTLKDENERLHEENATLKAEEDSAAQAISENEELRKMLGLSEKIREMTKVDATVTEWSSSNWANAFSISRGEADGVEVGDPVINSSGEVVGQVLEVGGSWSIVRSLVDTSMSIGASAGDTSALASGDFELMQEGLLKLVNVPSTARPVIGETVHTSGAGEVFPPELVIGTIVSVDKTNSGLTNFAVIQPAADLGNLSMVFVITEYEYTG